MFPCRKARLEKRGDHRASWPRGCDGAPRDDVLVEVVVRTRKVGHFFPGGTIDAFDVWVELQATDDKGQTISGAARLRMMAKARSILGTLLQIATD